MSFILVLLGTILTSFNFEEIRISNQQQNGMIKFQVSSLKRIAPISSKGGIINYFLGEYSKQ